MVARVRRFDRRTGRTSPPGGRCVHGFGERQDFGDEFSGFPGRPELIRRLGRDAVEPVRGAACVRTMGRIVVRHVDEQRAQRRVAGLRDGRRPIEPDHQRLEAGAGVGVLARQCLDQHQSERVDVAGRRHDLAAYLLGAEVIGGADRRVVHGEARVVGGDRDAEVSQLRRAEIVHGVCRNEDVRGFDVSMHDPRWCT